MRELGNFEANCIPEREGRKLAEPNKVGEVLMSLGPVRCMWIMLMILSMVFELVRHGLTRESLGTIVALELTFMAPLILWWGFGPSIEKWVEAA